ncbi:MAG: serine--tRNA ligase [Chlamydiae bacterium]|nr:serine--tRNA ligase [Chlamydiota bacterium]
MLDMKLLRSHPNEIEKKLQTKDPDISFSFLLSLDQNVRKLKQEVEELKAKRNHLSKQVGELKSQKKDASSVIEEVHSFGNKLHTLEESLKQEEEKLQHILDVLPNLPDESIKVSLNPKDNVCIKSVGEKPHFTFPAKNHVELNESLHLFDFARGAKISGSGWPVYRGMGARLEWALLNYMIDIHIKNGFEQWMVPHLVRPDMMYGAAQLPKFKDQLFKLHDKDYDLYLIPTSEVALNALHYDEILPMEELPKKYVSYTPCFRREAGAAGSQERGLIRVHQFNKVEMFCFALPEESDTLFEKMVASAEEILQGLELHYRNMLLVTGDMSFAAAKTLDVEVYLPGQERYYEVSSISNCRDFQARRSKIRYRAEDGHLHFVHTLNGSGLATSRLMVALLENNQQADGSVILPKALHKYLGSIHILKPR